MGENTVLIVYSRWVVLLHSTTHYIPPQLLCELTQAINSSCYQLGTRSWLDRKNKRGVQWKHRYKGHWYTHNRVKQWIKEQLNVPFEYSLTQWLAHDGNLCKRRDEWLWLEILIQLIRSTCTFSYMYTVQTCFSTGCSDVCTACI